MNLVTLILGALSSIRAIAANPALAESLGIDKYSALIDSLLGSATSIIARGETAAEDLKAFKLKVDTLRARIDAGERLSLTELDAIKAESDDLHAQMQALKSPAPPETD